MKRTEAQPIGALIDTLFTNPNIARKLAEGSLPSTWRQVVGDAIAEETRYVRLVNGKLHVRVQSSIARMELMMQRQSLVKAINQTSGCDLVQDIVIQ